MESESNLKGREAPEAEVDSGRCNNARRQIVDFEKLTVNTP